MKRLIQCGLTKREREIVGLVYVGLAGRHIARMLGITLDTMQNHLTNIYNKTGSDSLFELFLRMHKEQLGGTK